MRIIITSNTLLFGGAERQRVSLANELLQLGHQPQLRIIQQAGPLVDEIDNGVQLYKTRSLLDVDELGTEAACMISGTTKTEVAHALYVKFIRRRTRWLLAAHNPVTPQIATYPRSVRLAARFADAHVCLYRGQADLLKQTDSFDPAKIEIIGNGINTDKFINARLRSDSDLSSSAVTTKGRTAHSSRVEKATCALQLLFVGRLATQKGLVVLLEALMLVGNTFDWTLRIVGDGPDRDLRHASEFHALQDRITWSGSVPAEKALRDADLLVIPSLGEAYPLILLEGLVAGIPIIATRVGAIPDIVTGTNVELVDPGDPEALAGAIGRVRNSLAQREAQSWRDRIPLASKLGARRMAEQYERLALGQNSSIVAHIGPSVLLRGGISTVIADYVEHQGIPMTEVLALETFRGRSRTRDVILVLKSVRHLLRMQRTGRLAVAHVHMSQRGSFIREGAIVLFCKMSQIKTVVTIHGSRFDMFATNHPVITKNVLQLAGEIIVLTPQAQRLVSDLTFPAKVHRLFNPILFHPGAEPRDETTTTRNVFFAGEIGTRKGVDTLLRAWALVVKALPDAKLTLAGPLASEYREFATNALPPSATYIGELDAEGVRTHLDDCDIAVLPSRAEAMPKFILEAMSRSRPVIATDVGAIGTLIDQSTGRLVPPDAPEQLADALLELLSDPVLRSQLGSNAGNRVASQFDINDHMDILRSIYAIPQ
ncbi:glycosyltransferase family 4 protein [Rhodococcoides kroppenstedtii]|uniref:glycosyltransferase family 4 protein n=1 Tax=Rhodococcoides kroppenstedtii TaxID=293050 RepID=UPI0036299FDB